MVNPYSTYKDYLKETADNINSKLDKPINKHISLCSIGIFNASREGRYSYFYKLPWYYVFFKNKKFKLYMSLHNYFKYAMNVKVVLTTYKGEIQSIEFRWS